MLSSWTLVNRHHICWSLRLARNLLFFSLILSVCLSHSFKLLLLFCFSMESSHFLAAILHVALYETLFVDFWFRPPNTQNLLPKIYTKSPLTWLVWQIDWRCLRLTGFSGMADSVEPCNMLWGRPLLPWQRNWHKIAYKSACIAQTKDVSAYQGVFGDGRFYGTMQNVVGPTLVVMATKFGLGTEIKSPTGLSFYLLVSWTIAFQNCKMYLFVDIQKLGLYRIWLFQSVIKLDRTWPDLGTQIWPEPDPDLGQLVFPITEQLMASAMLSTAIKTQ